MSRLYTRTGDDGSSGLADGQRLSKASLRLETIGTVDELNSWLGIIAASQIPASEAELIQRLQHELFDLGAELAMPGGTRLQEAQVSRLEAAIDDLSSRVAPFKPFILPGGSLPAAQAHVARTVCRRAERAWVALQQAEEPVNPVTGRYLNRLSDLLFALARALNAAALVEDVRWIPTPPPKAGA